MSPTAKIVAREESIEAFAEEYPILERSNGEIEVEVEDMTSIFAFIADNEIPTEHIKVEGD